MDNDLISRSALIAEHCDGCNAIALGQCDHDVCGAAQLIMEAPAVDAVEVVRCKDCKHFNMREMECQNDAVSTDHEGGASYSLNFYLDDFCSYGERREADG